MAETEEDCIQGQATSNQHYTTHTHEDGDSPLSSSVQHSVSELMSHLEEVQSSKITH